ncbi:MAG: twin-arginine translocation signal domain-containing protein, partial [Acidimicrobiia bacterium]|nr:twin-arginine translocation signal domain-containing protein [Acidimicrobiia bacterium]
MSPADKTCLLKTPGSDTPDIVDALSSPLPSDARSVSRRRFLQAAAMASGAVALGPSLLAGPAGAAAPIGPGEGVLVLVTMAGGNDGLNTVIPIADGAYQAKRGALAIPASQALAISDDRALHPRLDALQALWNQGQVAVIDGVGTPGTNDLSHFSCMARWMGGNSNGGLTSGWLGRYIDGLPGGDDPFHGVAIGTSVPLV